MNSKKLKSDTIQISHKTDMEFNSHYPEENSEEVIKDITTGLDYLGFFDSLK